MGKVQVFYIR